MPIIENLAGLPRPKSRKPLMIAGAVALTIVICVLANSLKPLAILMSVAALYFGGAFASAKLLHRDQWPFKAADLEL